MFCKSSMLHKLLLSGACAMVMASANAVLITEWDFNGSSLSPTTGSGTLSAIGGVTTGYNTDTSNGGSSDPAATGMGLQTTTYPTDTALSGTAGIRVNVSTVGYNSIMVEFDTRHSNTSSRFLRFDYTLDGTNFVLGSTAAGTVFTGNAGDTWFNNRAVDLSSIAGAANNANFGFRVVTITDPAGSAYVASNPTGTYAGTGTLRYDMVQVSGTVVPEPGAWAAVATGLVGLAGLKRRK